MQAYRVPARHVQNLSADFTGRLEQSLWWKNCATSKREVLPNGLTILTEQMDHIRSVSMGIWVKSGSRHEDPNVNGISHFVEHMVFKGTTSRIAEDIARQVDSIGGNMDAFTGKETDLLQHQGAWTSICRWPSMS